jgi:crossover junction endodeoxyribonuclease RuvC
MKKSHQIVLGIDPGYDRCGFGVIKGSGMDWVHMAHGVISTQKLADFSERLREIADDYDEILKRFKPDLVVIEELFFSKSTTTALKVAEARGVLRMLAARKGIEVIEVKPNEVKLAVTGSGRADKRQMQQMVKITLKLAKIPKPDDAADALAIALAGGVRARY